MNVCKQYLANNVIKYRSTSSKCRRKNVDGYLNTYLRLFKTFGILVFATKRTKKVKRNIASIVIYLMKFYWLYVAVIYFSSAYILIIDAEKPKTNSKIPKSLLISLSISTGLFLIWWYMINFQTNFINKSWNYKNY